jgi:hypothetical protein
VLKGDLGRRLHLLGGFYVCTDNPVVLKGDLGRRLGPKFRGERQIGVVPRVPRLQRIKLFLPQFVTKVFIVHRNNLAEMLRPVAIAVL